MFLFGYVILLRGSWTRYLKNNSLLIKKIGKRLIFISHITLPLFWHSWARGVPCHFLNFFGAISSLDIFISSWSFAWFSKDIWVISPGLFTLVLYLNVEGIDVILIQCSITIVIVKKDNGQLGHSNSWWHLINLIKWWGQTGLYL